MTTELQTMTSGDVLETDSVKQGFVTMRVAGQLLGISVMAVQDVMRDLSISNVPLAPKEVAGLLNLRGRIVTVIDMRTRLKIVVPKEEGGHTIHVVVEHNEDLFSFMVDSVGDVLNLDASRIESTPANIEKHWKELASGVCRLDKELLVLLDVQSLLTF